jgi:hypothetical protein
MLSENMDGGKRGLKSVMWYVIGVGKKDKEKCVNK